MSEIIRDNILRAMNTQENINIAIEYVTKKRGISFNPKTYGYVDLFPISESEYITKSLVILTRDLDDTVTQIEVRNLSEKSYNKIYTDYNRIPINNISNAFDSDNIVVTESVIEADSINTHISNLCAISMNSASIKKSQLYMLASISKGKRLYIALNND